ncbi:hypothetical protein OA84_02385 [Kaistella solincola]|uniref:Uncharacterized protein n=1 Tax=Kaistella solincola TaxID=510955 RepID=A0ABR4ZTY2_9FLAO|nr:hypothetical protein OA84_02385 [Kaistella solincola]
MLYLDYFSTMELLFFWAPSPPSTPAFLLRCAPQKELRSSRGAVTVYLKTLFQIQIFTSIKNPKITAFSAQFLFPA